MKRTKYSYGFYSPKEHHPIVILFIRDRSAESEFYATVTNCIEQVLDEISKKHPEHYPPAVCAYMDSEGRVDLIGLREGKFVGFMALKNQEAEKKRWELAISRGHRICGDLTSLH